MLMVDKYESKESISSWEKVIITLYLTDIMVNKNVREKITEKT